MPRITSAQQHRQHIGDHTAQQDARQRNQRAQDQYTRSLAQRPGLHSGNVNRQQTAAAAVHLFSLLTSVNNAPSRAAQDPFFNDHHEEFTSGSPTAGPTTVESPSSTSTAAAIKDVLVKVGSFIELNDPLRFPGADAKPVLEGSKPQWPGPPYSDTATTPKPAGNFFERMLETAKEFFTTSPLKRLPVVVQGRLFTSVAKACATNETCSGFSDVMKVLADKIDVINAEPGSRFSLMTPILGQTRNIIHDYIDPPTVEDQQADDSCVPDVKKWTFSGALREIGVVLEHPIQSVSVGAGDLYALATTGKCLTPLQERRVADIASMVDLVVSDVTMVVPGLDAIAVAQSIVAPLLQQTADDLEGKAVPIEDRALLYGQIAMQAGVSIHQSSKAALNKIKIAAEPGSRPVQLSLPKFHVKDGVNHIPVTVEGEELKLPIHQVKKKVFVTARAPDGKAAAQEVHWNHVEQEWRFSGTGKFQRFTPQEQKVAKQYAIDSEVVKRQSPSGDLEYEIIHHSPGEGIELIDLHGHNVPIRRDAGNGRAWAYNAADPGAPLHEVVFTQGAWHLKAHPKRLERIRTLSTKSGEKLDVALLKTNKKGQETFARMDREAGFFYGPKYRLNSEGQLEPLGDKEPPSMGKTSGQGSGRKPSKAGKARGTRVSLKGMNVPGWLSSENFFRRPVENSPFIQYYSRSGPNTIGSERLVVAAHGSYNVIDYIDDPVTLSEDMTYKLLTPHDTRLLDPGLSYFVNPPSDFKAYVTLNSFNGQTVINEVDFNYQELPKFPAGYDPSHTDNTLGRSDGLQGYTLTNYPLYTDHIIRSALVDNRMLADVGMAPRTDVLMVDPTVVTVEQAKVVRSETARIIELDELGLLKNAKGERYKEIAFAHCRDFPENPAPVLYEMRSWSPPMPVAAPLRQRRDAAAAAPSQQSGDYGPESQDGNILTVTITRMYRDDVNEPFEVEYLEHYYELIPTPPGRDHNDAASSKPTTL
jgi:hypothetical protein